MASITISQVRFANGQVEDVPTDGVVVVVGPNNAGKSLLLSEILQCIQAGASHDTRWVSSVAIEKHGDALEFEEWFRARARVAPEGMPHAGDWVMGDPMMGSQISLSQGLDMWRTLPAIQPLAHHFSKLYDAMSRPNLLQSAAARNVMASATEPLHRLWDDRRLEHAISEVAERAFGFPISINRYAPQIEVLIGKPELPDEPLPPSAALLAEYARLQPVRMQGDGIRSFVGLVLNVLGSGHSVSIVDEPEVFLHPPQARMLGGVFARGSNYGPRQIFVATHSDDMLEGILDAARSRDVKVIRVADRRRSGARSASVLPNDEVRSLWSDPLLRYSRMLDGLFHQGVVVCEADSDCTVYRAALDASREGLSEHDLIFTQVGGKGRLPRALTHLRALALRVAVIADIDVLREPEALGSLIEAADGDPEIVRGDLALIRRQVDGRSSAPTVRALKESTAGVVSRRDSSAITDAEAAAIATSVRMRSGWREVKRSGDRSFEGEEFLAFRRVCSYLGGLGIFVVPVGELERWYPEVQAGHGASFATAVLESGKYAAPSAELLEFLGRVSRFFDLDQGEPALSS